MKQYITTEQVDELSEQGLKKLLEWWQPKWYDLFVWSKDAKLHGYGGMDRTAQNMLWTNYTEEHPILKEHIKKGWVIPILSVGQMIDYLKDKFGGVPMILHVWDKMSRVEIIDNEELCDALWLNVKEILNNE